MGAYTSLTYHVVFGTKYRRKTISPAFRDRLYDYTGGVIRAAGGHLIEIGGVEDHIHLMAGFALRHALSELVRDIKANSARSINEWRVLSHKF